MDPRLSTLAAPGDPPMLTDATRVAAWLKRHPVPWKVRRVGTLSGAEFDVVDAKGRRVSGLMQLGSRQEHAEAWAAVGNELGMRMFHQDAAGAAEEG